MGGSEAYQWLRHAYGVRVVRLQRHRLRGVHMDHGGSSRRIRLQHRQGRFLASHADYPCADSLVSINLLTSRISNNKSGLIKYKGLFLGELS